MTADELTAAAGDSVAATPKMGVTESIFPTPGASETAATDAPEIATPAPVATQSGVTTGEIEEYGGLVARAIAALREVDEPPGA